MICWKVVVGDSKPFTYITDQCKTEADVHEALFEKFCRPAVSVVRL